MLWNALILALREIRRNIMRSSLTMLGIVIGVAAVIVMVSLGRGATAQVSQQIASLGSNLLMVRKGQHFGPGQRMDAPAFNMKDVEAIERDIPSIAAVAPSASSRVIAIYGNTNWATAVIGTNEAFLKVRDWTLQAGREFTDSELRAGKSVCIIGETVRQQLFAAQDPLGGHIRLNKLSCEVIGLLASKGQTAMGSDQDDIILVPIRTFWRRIAGNQDIPQIYISAREGASTQRVQHDIELLLRERRHISPGEDDDFSVRDMQEIARTLTGTTEVLTALLGAVAAVSLLVGGIDIMNIMLVSVTERTREIGIRLAIGALEREVLMQFLVEAVVLSSFGGIVGILLAIFASMGLASMLQVPFIFSPGIVILAFLFSVGVGILFGYAPARKAARLDPIDALRYE